MTRATPNAVGLLQYYRVTLTDKIVRYHGKTHEQVEDITQNRHTLRGPSSLQEPDTLSAKGEKLLHQTLQNESMREKIK
jgi:hypothetical protein